MIPPERLEGFSPPLSLRDISPALWGRQKPVRFRENASPCRPHGVGEMSPSGDRGGGRGSGPIGPEGG